VQLALAIIEVEGWGSSRVGVSK